MTTTLKDLHKKLMKNKRFRRLWHDSKDFRLENMDLLNRLSKKRRKIRGLRRRILGLQDELDAIRKMWAGVIDE